MGRQLARLLALQGAITLIVAGGIFVWSNSQVSAAALLGGATAAASALAYGAGYWLAAGKATKPLRGFLVAELCRVVVAIVLLWIGITSLPGESAIAFLGAFAAALMAYLLLFLI